MKVCHALAITLSVAPISACVHSKAQASDAACEPPPHVMKATVMERTSDAGVVSGLVLAAASNEPLEAAIVDRGGLDAMSSTSLKGAFSLPRLSLGGDTSLVIRTRRIGYETRRDTIQLVKDRGARLTIFMAASQLCLAPVTVTTDFQ